MAPFTTETPAAPRLEARRRGLWHRIILVAIAGTSAPFLGGGWSTDDFSHIGRLLKHAGLSDIFLSPDPFGFYRPLAHSTLLLDATVWGFNPVMFRVSNLLIHLLVVVLAYAFARRLLTERAAFFSVLAFALTPKAHSIAIFWSSARPELMMSVLSFAALLCWVQWERTGGARWLVAAASSYVLAILSKETAALVPLLMFFTPPANQLLTKRRLLGAAALIPLAALPVALRLSAGALMPLSTDQHYVWVLSIYRWLRGIQVYLPRTLPSPGGLLVLVALPASLQIGRQKIVSALVTVSNLHLLIYAMVWFLVFIAPVLPIVARSELYLYLPGFGFCLLAGQLTDRLMGEVRRKGPIVAGLILYVLALVSYHVVRDVQASQVFQFTDAFVHAIEQNAWLRTYRGDLVLVPADPGTERLLRDGIGGFMNVVLEDTLGQTRINAVIAYADQPQSSSGQRIICTYDGRRVLLQLESSPDRR